MNRNYTKIIVLALSSSFLVTQSYGITLASTNIANSTTQPNTTIQVTSASSTPIPVLADIQDSYAKFSIQTVVQAGIFGTDSNGLFRPHNPVNREQLAIILARAFKLNINDASKRFRDVDDWAIPYVNAVVDAKIEQNLSSNTFGAHQTVSHEQFITSIIKGLGFGQDAQSCDFGTTYQDRGNIYEPFQAYIGFAQRIGLLDGIQWTTSSGPNTVEPKLNIERQDAAYIIAKFLQSHDELTARADSLYQKSQNPISITKVDLESYQSSDFHHPEQISLERSFKTGNLLTEIFQVMPTPDQYPFSIADGGDNQHLYIADNQDGLIYQVKKSDSTLVNTISPRNKPNNNIRGICLDDNQNMYIYYYGGIIQHIDQNGNELDHFVGPTTYGQSLVYHDGMLYLLDPYGHVFEIDPNTKKTLKKNVLLTPDGNEFNDISTFSLAWDGKHYIVSNGKDNWKLYEYDAQFHFLRTITSNQWNITGLTYEGSELEMLNSDSKKLIRFRVADDIAYDVAQDTTPHYQYINTLFTTPDIEQAFPVYSDRNAFLVYNDSMAMSNNTLKPYVSFLDSHGNRIGTMFDTFVYLPSPALNNYKFNNSTEFTLWNSYLNKTMKDMSILDDEWGMRNKDLSKADPANVYIAVPYPSTDFNLETRESLIDAYINNAINNFQTSNFKNLKLKGFYWYREYADRGEPIVVHFSQFVHNKGLTTMWIPSHSYNKGDGYMDLDLTNDYSQLHFDEVFEQSNYFFDEPLGSQNPNRFFSIAISGPLYQKAFEMEMSTYLLGDASGAHTQYFNDYLHYGDLFGFLYGSKAWYDEGQIARAFTKNYTLYSTIHDVVVGTYHDPSINRQQPVDGSITTSTPINLPIDTKLRFDITAKQPFDIKTITIHTNDPIHQKVEFTGTIRNDEELVLKHETLVKQDIGQAPNGLRIGFNIPLNTPVHIIVLPDNN